MSWSWSAEEDAAMDYLPHAAQVLYLRVLRRRMDFNTGVVGISCRISYQQIGEWLEVRPPAKSTKPIVRLTVGEIRAALVQLERAGLIVRVERDGEVMPLVFLLPFARTGLIREKYEQQDEQQQKAVRATGNLHFVSGANKNGKNQTISTACGPYLAVDNSQKPDQKTGMNNRKTKDEQQDEQQTSGMSESCYRLSLKTIYSGLRGNGAVIPDDWMPSDANKLTICRELSLPINFVESKARDIRLLWKLDLVVAYDWDKYFYGYCKNKLADGDAEFCTARRLLLEARSSGGDYAG